MKAWSVIALLFAVAILATIPISPQVTPRGVEPSVDEAQATTYGRYRRVHRRVHRRSYRSARRGYHGAGGSYWGCVGYFGPGCCGFPGHCPRGYYGSYWRH
jgi:hypothetical protein